MLTAHRVLTNIPISCSKFLDPNTHRERHGSHNMSDVSLELDTQKYLLLKIKNSPKCMLLLLRVVFLALGTPISIFYPLSSLRVYLIELLGASLVAQTGKKLPAIRETWVQSLGQEDPLQEEIATDSSILAWRIPTDRAAWWTTIHRVPKSQTQLRQLSTQDSYHQSQRPVHHSFHSSRSSQK